MPSFFGESPSLRRKKVGFFPSPLGPDGRPFAWKSSRFSICFRFGVDQANKLRACDDLKHSMTNLACAARTPIQLVSWGHIDQLANFLASNGGDWVMFKSDHEAAYKQLPIDPADMKNAIVALRGPVSLRWYGFVSRTLVFGSTTDVLHYNALSRIITSLTNRCLGIPLVGYFDDFAALIRKHLGQKALGSFTRFFALLGIQLKPGKSEVGSSITFLGLLGHFPSRGNGHCLSISLPPEKRRRWSALIAGYLRDGRIVRSSLDKLIGKLLFSQTSVFGKFPRTQLRPLYQKLNRRVYNAHLSPYERSVFSWWQSVIADFTPRLAVPRPIRPHWIIYTDSATTPPRLCDLLFDGATSSPSLHLLCSSRATVTWTYLFRWTRLIFGLELLAIVLFFEDHAPFLRGKCCWVYLDSNNSLAALVSGDSNTDVIAVLVARFWQLVQARDICVWFSRVRSKINPSDLPTRNEIPPL